MVQPPPSTDFADVRRLVSSGAPPALIVSDPAWKRMLEEIDAGLARRKETIDRVATDLGIMLEDHQKQRLSQPQGPNGGWWPQEASMGYPGQQDHPPYGPPGYHYPSRGPPCNRTTDGMSSPAAMPVPPPFPTPPPGYNHPYEDQETELQRRKRQALQRMSSAAPGGPQSEGADAGYGPPPDPSDKEAFEAYRRACWLKYYQHMAALQTPGQTSDQPDERRTPPPPSNTIQMPQEDDEDDDINKELLGL